MLELNKLYNMDCMEGMKLIPDNSIDLIVTDPPYKIIQGGCTNKAVRLKGSNDLTKGGIFKENNIKFSEWLPELYRILKNDTHCYIMVNDRNMLEMLTETKKAKFQLLNILTWKKTKHAPNRYYLKNSEFIIFLRKGRAKNINNMGTMQVLEIDNVENKCHPTEKPIELMKILIKNSSNINELIFDPFSGSASTLIAAKELNRNFIGFELDNKYYDIANKRLENDFKQLSII